MVERFLRPREYRRKKEIGILFERGLNLFFNLPESVKKHSSETSLGEIAVKRIKKLPRVDHKFLLRNEENRDGKTKMCVGFEEQDYWVGIEVPGFRVRYLAGNPTSQVLHEKKAGDLWQVVFSEEREEWDGFERVIKIGEALLDN